MFVYTITKKRAGRLLLVSLAVIVGIIIGIAAISTSVKTGADARRVPIYSVERGDGKIALTFNCAWGNSNTDELLAVLERENVKASFFVTGEFCDKYPDDVLRIFRAGHEIQNHSNAHPHIEGANVNDIIHDTREAENKIRKITGVAPTLYRAPYGEYDNNSVFAVNGMGYKYIQWSVDSIDWQKPDSKTIVKRVVDGVKSGGIVLFHNDIENTAAALPEIIAKLKEKGFSFVTVSELIYHDNYTIDSNGRQFPSGDVNAQIHLPGSNVNAAFELIVANLSIEEILSLENGLSPELALKLSSILSREQIDTIMALSNDEMQSAWGALVEAKITGQTGNPPLDGETGDSTGTTAATPITNGGGTVGVTLPSMPGGTLPGAKGGNVAGDTVTGTTAPDYTLPPLPETTAETTAAATASTATSATDDGDTTLPVLGDK